MPCLSCLEEGEQVCVDRVSLRRDHTARIILVRLQCAILEQFGRDGIGIRYDLVVLAVHNQYRHGIFFRSSVKSVCEKATIPSGRGAGVIEPVKLSAPSRLPSGPGTAWYPLVPEKFFISHKYAIDSRSRFLRWVGPGANRLA
jgi:hypothetical protein